MFHSFGDTSFTSQCDSVPGHIKGKISLVIDLLKNVFQQCHWVIGSGAECFLHRAVLSSEAAERSLASRFHQCHQITEKAVSSGRESFEAGAQFLSGGHSSLSPLK
jgi:hypothetical protein